MEENTNKLTKPNKNTIILHLSEELETKARDKALKEGYKSLQEKIRAFLIRETTGESTEYALFTEQEVKHILSDDAVASGCTGEEIQKYIDERFSALYRGRATYYNGKLVKLLPTS